MHATLPKLETSDFPALRRKRLDTLQVNLGYKCNQTCVHCHVNAGPTRTEMMSRETVSEVIAFLKASGIGTLDITGGAPELNQHFRGLALAARNLGVHVIDRCNLTILGEPGQEDLAQFLVQRCLDPNHTCVGCVCGTICSQQEFALGATEYIEREVIGAVARGKTRRDERLRTHLRTTAGDSRRCRRGMSHRFRCQLLHVRVTGGVALHHAHAKT